MSLIFKIFYSVLTQKGMMKPTIVFLDYHSLMNMSNNPLEMASKWYSDHYRNNHDCLQKIHQAVGSSILYVSAHALGFGIGETSVESTEKLWPGNDLWYRKPCISDFLSEKISLYWSNINSILKGTICNSDTLLIPNYILPFIY